MLSSMLDIDVENNQTQLHVGETSLTISVCGVVGGIIVLSGFGGVINSFGGSGISIFGTERINGFPHPTRNRKEIVMRYFIVLPPFSSKASQVT
jgi:hypothetical protein